MVGFVIEFWHFLRARKKLWLMPIMLVFLLFGSLIVFTKGSMIAPFIYALY